MTRAPCRDSAAIAVIEVEVAETPAVNPEEGSSSLPVHPSWLPERGPIRSRQGR